MQHCYPEPVTFLAIGDLEVGITDGDNGKRQLGAARTMQRLADPEAHRYPNP